MTLSPIPTLDFKRPRTAWALAAVLLGGCASLNQPPAGAGAAASANGTARPPVAAAAPPASGVPPGTPQPGATPPGTPQPFASVIKDAKKIEGGLFTLYQKDCLLYTSPSPRDGLLSRMPSSA